LKDRSGKAAATHAQVHNATETGGFDLVHEIAQGFQVVLHLLRQMQPAK
jgi:hypothetical protein